MDFPLSIPQSVGVAAIVAAGAYVQGCVGFGLGLVSVPVLTMIDTRLVPGPIILGSMLLNILIAHADHEAIHLEQLKRAAIAAAPGTVIGAMFVATAPDVGLKIVIGAITLAAVGISVLGWHAPPTNRNVSIAGFVSGIMSAAASIGGPPMAIVYSREQAARLRGTLAGFFICVGLVAIVPLALADQMTAAHLLCTLAIAPGILIGFAIGRWTGRLMPQAALRPMVLSVAALGAVALIVKALTT